MKAVIHQPYFLPWMGYFSKLIYADKFIVLDNVNFTKRSYIDRVQVINSMGNLMWVGLPIGQQFKKKINEIKYTNNKHIIKIIKSLYAAYSKARFFKKNISKIENILLKSVSEHNKLYEINMYIIIEILSFLELDIPKIIYCSNYPEIDKATDRLIFLLKENECSTLITGNGGSLEAHNIKKIINSGCSIHLQDYYKNHPKYYQTRREYLGFAKGLSIVDCIFNEGINKTRDFLLDKNNVPRLYLDKI